MDEIVTPKPKRRQANRTGAVETFKRKDGSIYFRGCIRLADGTRERIDIPDRFQNPKGAKFYVESAQAREDERGTLLAKKKKRAERRRIRVMPTAEMATWLDEWI